MAGIDTILAVGSDLASSRRVVDLAARYGMVYAAVGIHPHEARTFGADGDAVRHLLESEKVVAVGEIGLDYYRERSSREEQMTAFRSQLEWACERNLPVSVHNRDADEDTMRVLHGATRVVLHCFSGSDAMAHEAVGRGYKLSFAGNLTFPKSERLRQVAKWLPDEAILVESDAPVLAPQRHRGRRNEPAFVALTLECLAGIRNVIPQQLSARITRNAADVFAWGEA